MNEGYIKSGPHPSLHQHSGEVREVQFELQRACPSGHQINIDSFAELPLPMPVWVSWPAVRNISGWCDSRVLYRITPDELDRAQKRWPGKYVGSYVCEHMGRLIE